MDEADNEFNEDNETPEAIVAHYNACGYTPDNVPTSTEKLPGTRTFVPKVEIAEVYWAGSGWVVWPIG